jgi:predicted nucleic acid-binding Zn ribbon protein
VTEPPPGYDSTEDGTEAPPDDAFAALSGADAAKEALARARAAAAAAPRSRSGPRPSTGSTARSGARSDDRDPQLLGTSVDRLLRDRGWTEPAAVGGLTGRWAEIVGADVAEHVRPETFEQAADGRGLMLVLRADSTAWATTLTYMLPQVRARIDAELGTGVVRDISILGPASPSWKHGRLAAPGRGPRDTYG